MDNDNKKRVLMVLAPKNFKDEEYFQPKVILQASGVEVLTAAKTDKEEVTGVKGGKAKVDIDLRKVKVDNFNGIIFVGGDGAKTYFKDKKVWRLVKQFYDSGKLVGAICIAPAILAYAGILAGKNVTSFATQEKILKKAKANWTNKSIEADHNIITARDADAALDFGRKLLDFLQS